MPKKYQPLGVGMTPSKTELGKFLRVRRLELKLRQIEVAKFSGMCQSYYSALEIGKVKSIRKPELLKSLSEALQCELRQLQLLIPGKSGPKNELGKFIRAQRQQLGLTHKELAKNAGINIDTTQAMENDKTSNISYPLIEPLAKALKLEFSALSKYAGRTTEKTSDSDLGQLVRNHRKKLGFSQAQLAKKLQITKQFLSQIELGQCLLIKNDAVIERLAEVLELDLVKLQVLRPKPKISKIRTVRSRSTPLGKFLTARRLELGLSPTELAQRMGNWPSMISAVERGIYHPGPKLLNKLSEALKCQVPVDLMPPPKKLGRPKST